MTGHMARTARQDQVPDLGCGGYNKRGDCRV